ncbi:MAG: HU family DNA-binding protein [Holosporaceae bacterium]|jgi:nucleoid DNA-binding protein|nr:HU family DNA-binding protein [Holosporaceae bacterium]
MTKNELAKAISEESGFTIKDATKFLDAFVDVTTDALSRGNDVALVGFGTFSRAERSARTGRDFRTGQSVEISASKTVKFKIGKNLKEAVN